MTDKEKIELIIQDKHLNSTQFCNEVCIAPGTLSHIRNGRTEPTLNILRSIIQAFPDINPAWLFYGEEPMYKNSDSPTPQEADENDTYLNSHADDVAPEDNQLSFAFPATPPSSTRGAVSNGSVNGSSSVPTSSQASGTSRRSSASTPAPSPLNVQEIVAETLKQQQRPQRKVVEVRIFFDDGTFETFSAN
ncbi:MAG: helix-turn-helix transcriptional regulator [Bacteroidaceae bacterium]|nr:helix-turn-helix transcriptional regulator [Bacteroidaceae bacterium]